MEIIYRFIPKFIPIVRKEALIWYRLKMNTPDYKFQVSFLFKQ